MLKLLIPVAAMTIAVAPALADSTERTWTQEPDQLIHVDSSDAGKDPNFKSLVRIIKAEGGDHPTIQLSCQITTSGYKALNFSVQLDPENTYEDDADRSPRFHHISGIMEVRDEKFPDRYAFHAKSTKLIPLSREVPSRIYNSVLALPEKNDVFVAFAKFCPVTNGGKFDASVFNTLKGMELTPNL